MSPIGNTTPRDVSSGSPRGARPRGPAVYDNSSAAAAVMGQNKLSTEAGMAAASQAAIQSKIRAQQKQQEELLTVALTPPQQRTQQQIEVLCEFLSSTHLLRHLQPTNIRDLAQSMTGRHCQDGDLIYAQQDQAKHFYVVLAGEVVMYETDASNSGSVKPGQQQGSNPNGHQQPQQHPYLDEMSFSGTKQPGAFPSANTSKQAGGRSPRSPRGPKSAAAAAGSSTTATPRQLACAPTLQIPDMIEVRRVGPREAFGEDDVSTLGSCSKRQQTAVATGTNNTTWAQLANRAAAPSSSTAGLAVTSTPGSAAMGLGSAAGVTVPPAVSSSAPGGVASESSVRGFLDAKRRSMGRSPGGGASVEGGVVLLQLSADDYGAVLEGRLSAMLEEKVSFLGNLPALKGLNSSYLRSLAHCFHQVHFEPREVVVRQGDASDCMYVLKSGQVCVLIDPTMTLTETGPVNAAAAGSGGLAGDSEVDTNKLVQVCLLGSGSIIGDMSVREGAGGAPRRSATVVALTELITYKVPLREFKRRMPADVLEGMRQVANQKLVMNERQASSRTAAAGKEGHIYLGGLAVPGAVLQGKALRTLMESQQAGAGAPVGGLLDALEMFFGTSSPPGSESKPRAVVGKAEEVEEYVTSLTRNGFIAAPPAEFLALLTDWRSSRTATDVTPFDRRVPVGREFPLPIPQRSDSSPLSQQPTTAARSSSSSPVKQQKQQSPGSSTALLARSAQRAGAPAEYISGSSTWGKAQIPVAPAIHVQTHLASPASPGHAAGSSSANLLSAGTPTSGPLLLERLGEAQPPAFPSTPQSVDTAISAVSHSRPPKLQSPSPVSNPSQQAGSPATSGSPGRMQNQQQLPVSSPRSFRETLDNLVQQKQQQLLSGVMSPQAAKSSSNSPKSAQHASAAIRDATQQLAAGRSSPTPAGGFGNNLSPFLGPARGGGFKGVLVKAALAPMSSPAASLELRSAASAPANAQGGHVQPGTTVSPKPPPEPTLHEAQVKASSLFRPGSEVGINNTSSKQGAKKPGGNNSKAATAHGPKVTAIDAAAVHNTMAVLEEFGDKLDAAVVISRKGEPQLDFHTGEYAAVAQTGRIASPTK